MARAIPRIQRFFDTLDVEQQALLTVFVDRAYGPDDRTDLQELAAKAYLLGYREAAQQFAPPVSSNLIS